MLIRKHMEHTVNDLIKEKAKELFLKYGLKNVTMDDIAHLCGISKKTIYQAFDSKDALVLAIVDDLIRSHKEILKTAHASAKDAIDEVLKQDRGFSLVCRDVRPSFMYDLEMFYPEIWKQIEQYQLDIHEANLENLKGGMHEQLYREDVNITLLAALRMEQLLNFLRPKAFMNNELSYAQLIAEFTVVYLHSLTTEKGKKLLYEYINQ